MRGHRPEDASQALQPFRSLTGLHLPPHTSELCVGSVAEGPQTLGLVPLSCEIGSGKGRRARLVEQGV